MTVSKIPNCPAVSVPIITQRGMRPTVHSFMNPVSLAIFARRTMIVPSPPAPALFTLDSNVSAGCEMMAAATPAMTPEVRLTERFPPLDIWLGLEDIATVGRCEHDDARVAVEAVHL